ncbi:uncharacterized protein N7496_004350 [Penicillium cataractarum]|uniref:Uncharacterized protein n=1 Tax=Penicillium cataractarum TaxID=2100454 RepID=A0A9W9SNU8_9EURO|nr:uncharacterized protein N7496_004350 [Penicillium cataractarum]KAJ5381922.1 hypothetical protein N7496_004350 [Penicillium cataractarum]
MSAQVQQCFKYGACRRHGLSSSSEPLISMVSTDELFTGVTECRICGVKVETQAEYKEYTASFANDPYDRVVIPADVLELDVFGLDTPDVSVPEVIALAANARGSFDFGM